MRGQALRFRHEWVGAGNYPIDFQRVPSTENDYGINLYWKYECRLELLRARSTRGWPRCALTRQSTSPSVVHPRKSLLKQFLDIHNRGQTRFVHKPLIVLMNYAINRIASRK
jgi:hypothetical protein